LGALIGIIMQHISSSVAYSNCNGLYIWALLGLMVAFWRSGPLPASGSAVVRHSKVLTSA